MSKLLNRRKFIQNAGKIGLASSSLPFLAKAKHHKKKRFTLGLSQYSLRALLRDGSLDALDFPQFTVDQFRSEERRVGKECRSRWSPYH